MKGIVFGIAVVAILSSGVYFSQMNDVAALLNPQPQIQTAPVLAPIKADNRINAEAKVVPVRSAALAVPLSGRVSMVLVTEGDRVELGQLMLTLENARQAVAVELAQAGLKRAQARLEELKNGPRDLEIEVAQSAVSIAEAQLVKATQGARREDIAVAEASLAAAQASLEKAKEGPDENQIIAARAELANAEAKLRVSQAMYDAVKWMPDIGVQPQTLQLEQDTNTYNAAKARLEKLLRGPGDLAIASAQSQVEKAQAELNRVAAPARAADYGMVVAEIRKAKAQLALIREGTRPEVIAAAEADVASAEATLREAKIALAETQLRAPFAGVIASLDVTTGEHVSPGNPIIRLAGFPAWQIQTTDLNELNVTKIRTGAAATIKVDAIPGLALQGKVVAIRAIGENKSGDINYTVIIQPDKNDERLRWNMTAEVTIEAEPVLVEDANLSEDTNRSEGANPSEDAGSSENFTDEGL